MKRERITRATQFDGKNLQDIFDIPCVVGIYTGAGAACHYLRRRDDEKLSCLCGRLDLSDRARRHRLLDGVSERSLSDEAAHLTSKSIAFRL